ncbi:MAG: hypothetical protein JWP09_226 [Candidatus Taylorbacteria bacterium]|nr:hypothetical protein [Candidatus Taylorbacteria bacterium]
MDQFIFFVKWILPFSPLLVLALHFHFRSKRKRWSHCNTCRRRIEVTHSFEDNQDEAECRHCGVRWRLVKGEGWKKNQGAIT